MTQFEIDEIRTVRLGGLKQKIHIRSCSVKNPILLFLHGGPGVPNRHSIMRNHAEFAAYFTVVAWDQRGTGGSYFGAKPVTMKLDRFVEDIDELTAYLCSEFGQQKIFLIGGSWGTELGIRYIKAHPEHIQAYVGFGQVVNGFLNEAITYDFVLNQAKEAGDQKALDTLKRIGPPVDGCYSPVYKGLMKHRALLAKYGGSNVKRASLWEGTVKPVLLSREYSLIDKIGIVKGSHYSLATMWREIVRYDFTKEASELDVPVYFFQGKLDYNTPSSLVPLYFEMLTAPHKELIWFEKSAHNPLNEEKKRFHELLIEKLLAPVTEK